MEVVVQHGESSSGDREIPVVETDPKDEYKPKELAELVLLPETMGYRLTLLICRAENLARGQAELVKALYALRDAVKRGDID